MAKKKSNPHSEDNNSKPTKTQHQIPDDVASEKFDNLKSLNAMLLKETVERRHQVDSLSQTNLSLKSELNRCNSEKILLESELNRCNSDKLSLESELTRCNSDKFSLKSELNRLTERAVMLELEKGLVCRFVCVQVNEMADRIGDLERDVKRVLEEERSAFRARLDSRIECENGLQSKLVKAEKEESEVSEKYRNMKVVYNNLALDKKAIERKMDLITSEKDLVERNLAESKSDFEKIVTEKKVIENERNMEERKKNELVNKLRIKEEDLVKKVSDLEKKCVVGLEKEAEMSMKIDFLVKEKQEVEGSIRKLTQEKCLVWKDLNDAKNTIATLEKNLHEKISKMEMGIEEKSALAHDIHKLKTALAKTQNEHEDTKAKLARSEVNSTQILKILKTTSSICNSEDNSKMGIGERDFGEDIKDHVTEIEEIRKVFNMVKDHVGKAEKGKRFWRMVTSVTTVLAASVSLAYVVGGGY